MYRKGKYSRLVEKVTLSTIAQNYGVCLRIILVIFTLIFSIINAEVKNDTLAEFLKAGSNRFSNPGEAIRLFEEIIRKYPGAKYAARSQNEIGGTYRFCLKDFVKAQEAFEKTINKYPNTHEASSAKHYLKNLFFYAELEELIKFIENNPKSNLLAQAQFYIGKYFHRKKEFESAIKEYKKLINKFPKSNYSKAAKEYITKYDQIKREEAKLEKLTKTTEKSERVANYIFKVGKMYYDFFLEYQVLLEECVGIYLTPAFEKFQQLIKEYPDSKWTDDAQYYILRNEAINSGEGGDISGYGYYALKFYEFYNKYPDSDFAPELLYWCGDLISRYLGFDLGDGRIIDRFLSIGAWLNPPDTHSFSINNPWRNLGSDPKQYFLYAIKTFERVLDKYPTSKYVSQAKEQIKITNERIKQLEREINESELNEIKGQVEFNDYFKNWTIFDSTRHKGFVITGEKLDTIKQFNGKIITVLGILGKKTTSTQHHEIYDKAERIEWKAICVTSIKMKD